MTTAPPELRMNRSPDEGAVAARPTERRPRGSLVVFSDDWGRHPSSCQHLVRRLARNYEVLWVNTIGTRGPKLDIATLRRAGEKLLRRSTPRNRTTADAPSPVRVANPLMWPWFRRAADRRLNRSLLLRALRRPIAQLPRPVFAVTTIPLVADLVGELPVDRWIYYCVDDLAAWPGLESGPLQRMEGELVAKVDAAAAVSDVLQLRLKSQGRESAVISHGVDFEHWQAGDASGPLPEALASAEQPWVVFWGLLDERLDADWILAAADAMSSGTIALVGPVVAMDPRLRRHPRVVVAGQIPFENLPAAAARAAVLVMPYRRMPATEAMQPLKLKEYLATGLPCVVRRLPATDPWEDCLDVASSADEFARLVVERVTSGLPAAQRTARERLHAESWQVKARLLDALIQSTLGNGAAR